MNADPYISPSAVASPFEWTVHRAALQPGRAVFAGGLCATAAGVSWLAFHLPLFTLGVAVALFASLADFFLPVRYRLTKRGAEARHLWPLAAMEWRQVKRVRVSNTGIMLSPMRRSSRLDAYRGMVLPFGTEDPARITDAAQRFHAAANPPQEVRT